MTIPPDVEDVDGGGTSYTTARNIANWFIHGTLYGSGLDTSSETPTITVEIDSPIDTTIPAGLLDHGDAIAIIDTGRGVQEVCTLTDFALSGPGIYWLSIERVGKYDTQMHSHPVGTGIWIGRYGWLKANAWQSISSVPYGGTLRVKVLPSAIGRVLPAADATPITCPFLARYQRPLPPYRLTILPSLQFSGEGSFLPSWLRKYAGGDNVVPSWDSNPYFVTDMRLPADAWDPDAPGDPYWLADTLAFDTTSPADYIPIPTFGGIYQTFKFRVGTRQNLVYYDSAEHGTLYCWEWAEATMTKI